MWTNKIIAGLITVYTGLCSASLMPTDPKEIFVSKDSRSEMVTFVNPCYSQYSDVKSIDIPNGSMLNFASSGIIGKTIRAAEGVNDISNPLGITHSGVVVVDSPKEIYDIVVKKMEKIDGKKRGITKDAGEAILKELQQFYGPRISATRWDKDYEIFAPFSLESDGSAKEVLKGIYPHVHMHVLSHSLSNYSGNVYLRTLDIPVTTYYSRTFVRNCLGKKYESLLGIKELLAATQEKNKQEKTERLFCSELAALFYEKTGVISDSVNVSNITPECFGYDAKEFDILKDVAGKEIALKEAYKFSRSDTNGTSLWGHITKGFVKFMNQIF